MAAKVAAAKLQLGKKFPAEKYLNWGKYPPCKMMSSGEVEYPCGHSLTPDLVEGVKLSLSGDRAQACPACRARLFQEGAARAAACERACRILGITQDGVRIVRASGTENRPFENLTLSPKKE